MLDLMWFTQLVETCKMFQRTLVRYIKPGDIVVSPGSGTKELLVVLVIKLFDDNKSCARITFLNSKNKILKSDGWVALHKIGNKQ